MYIYIYIYDITKLSPIPDGDLTNSIVFYYIDDVKGIGPCIFVHIYS